MDTAIGIIEALTAVGLLILAVNNATLVEKVVTYIRSTVTGTINLGRSTA